MSPEREINLRGVTINCPETGQDFEAFIDLNRLIEGKDIILGCPLGEEFIAVRSQPKDGLFKTVYICRKCGLIYDTLFEE